MKLNITIEQAKEFVKTGKVVLVQLKKEGEKLEPEETPVNSTNIEVIEMELKAREIMSKAWGFPVILKNGRCILRINSVRFLCYKGKKLEQCIFCDSLGVKNEDFLTGRLFDHEQKWKPLQFKVESIEEKKLQEALEESKGGYEWTKLNQKKIPKEAIIPETLKHEVVTWTNEKWNPSVWIIKGKVKG